MIIDIEKAYSYYINNIDKTCDKKVLDFISFEKAFKGYLTYLYNMNPIFENLMEVSKCGNSRLVNFNIVINKIK